MIHNLISIFNFHQFIHIQQCHFKPYQKSEWHHSQQNHSVCLLAVIFNEFNH